MSDRFFRALTDARDCSFDEDADDVYDQVVLLVRRTSKAFVSVAGGDIRALSEHVLHLAQSEPDPEDALDHLVDEVAAANFGSEIKAIAMGHIDQMRRLEALYGFYKVINPDRPLH